ncbi:urease accessory protein UreD [Streptomyces sp. SCSIO 75703]|uniref:urease accessory protein UreD n=1 Tax=unclassified Streptomyces TaxID=2593676 RepID=UPI00055CF60C|nr:MULTISPECIES: urease accessory protein UreD [unclassified Streptomyces]
MTAATALLATERAPGPASGRAATRVCVLRSGWPLMLRSTAALAPTPVTDWAGRSAEPARVHLAAGAAGPLGGDLLRLEVRVGEGSALVLGEIAPTLLLPGTYGEESRLDVRVRVDAGGCLAWLPELVIAGRDCRHRTDVRITLARDARLVMREEVLFGRHGETPGRFRQRIRVETPAGPLHDQELAVGPGAPGWDGPAVTGGHRTAGTLLVVDPGAVSAERARGALAGPGTAVMDLGGGVLVGALAPDTADLRRRLEGAAALLTGADAPVPAAAG